MVMTLEKKPSSQKLYDKSLRWQHQRFRLYGITQRALKPSIFGPQHLSGELVSQMLQTSLSHLKRFLILSKLVCSFGCQFLLISFVSTFCPLFVDNLTYETHHCFMSAAVTCTGLIWSRYSTVITPKNWNLFSVNVAMAGTGIYQLARKIRHDCYSEVEEVPAKE
ncbi:hypothetical protein MUK42_17030 [Musa troglodytarum]|uniref:Mitochondrial pyruvate carrier n=1 Tax=Musa troglodytarum TaxID=320322 RepID=A0A9E7KN39_9LILI|nr:hypothetical protein MUK42_17030 [Musa troglodytarum]